MKSPQLRGLIHQFKINPSIPLYHGVQISG